MKKTGPIPMGRSFVLPVDAREVGLLRLYRDRNNLLRSNPQAPGGPQPALSLEETVKDLWDQTLGQVRRLLQAEQEQRLVARYREAKPEAQATVEKALGL